MEDALKKFGKNPPIEVMGTVAVALGREAVFWEGVMEVSTVGGKGLAKALPIDGLQEIYRTIFALCPSFHHNADEFDKKGPGAKLP